MSGVTVERAQEIVNKIREKNGGLTAEDRQRTPGNVLQVLENVLRQLGASTRAIARDLYTSESRFVYELIQNAEDNSYNLTRNGDPFIKFTLTPEKIVVENNEDGFNEADVRSICKVGDSTKVNRTGFIGEKGIGFKSVFQVAKKVQIQSGPFNFYFEHLPDGTGMGMITPMNEEDDVPAFYDGTRMTLSLLHPDGFDERVNDLCNIPDALILFLPKLQRIAVFVQEEDGDSFRIVHECREHEYSSTVRLFKRVDDEVSEKLYHIERSTFVDLPSDVARQNRNRAEVILAFPITSDSRPIIEPQLAFSFLPIRNFGFKFLIQSDFITSANRQDIRLCRWNDRLLAHISEVFLDAVDKFCSRPILQYEWLYFLPGTDIPHEFWNRLHGMIIKLLARHPILLTRSGVRQLPSRLQQLSERHCDKHGQPLFKDLYQEVYLSSEYHSEHTAHLQELGVTNLSWDNIIARITPYLQGQQPQFLHPDQDEDWHTRVANLLIRGLGSRKAKSIQSKIRELDLIPLRDGSLSDNLANNIYFPTDIFGNHVPGDLGLEIVDDNALTNNTRKSLYEILEVQYCQPSLVMNQIVKSYNPGLGITLTDSVSHLKYLYQTLPDNEALDNCIFVMDQSEVPIYRKFVTFGRSIVVDDIYFDTIGDFGTRHLAQELESNLLPGIHIIHNTYLEAVSSHDELNERPWKQWLKKKALIREVPRLRNSSTSGISSLFTKIIKDQPQLLVGVLKRYWNSYNKEKTEAIEEVIRNAEVPCNGTDIRRPLKATYLPIPHLTSICDGACINDWFDLFLDLGGPSGTSETLTEWKFLEVFGVGTKPDVNFFRDVLSTLTDHVTGQDLKRGLFYIYEKLSDEFRAHHRDVISDILDDLSAVCIPARTVQTTTLSNCVWNGLPYLHVKSCLSQYPEYTENHKASFLFREILALRDADCVTYTDELIYLQRPTSAGQLSFDNICAIYAEIMNTTQCQEDWEYIREKFETKRLIYIPTKQDWFAPTSCVWADASNLGRQHGIGSIYPNLEALFTEKLHIQEPTIGIYIEQLQLLAAANPPCIAEIKRTINYINEFRPTQGSLEEMIQLICLPVRVSGLIIKLMKPSEAFFITDRRNYGELFQDKVPVLDFSLEEIHCIHPFLNALGLTDRYMSVVVKETTTVQRRSDTPSNILSRSFRAKSKAFYRCALHYRSTDIHTNGHEIYHKLRHALVYESDGFTKDLRLSYGGLTVNALSDQGIFHLEDSNRTLKLFVPRDKGQREKCYLTQLPKALERYLHIDNPRASKALVQVILASVDALDYVLDEDGIVGIPHSDLASFEQIEESDSLGEEDHVPISSERPGRPHSDTAHESEAHIDGHLNTPHSTLPSISNEARSITSHSRSSTPYLPVDRAEHQNDPPIPLAEVSQYMRILEKVIRIARGFNIPSVYAQFATFSATPGLSREEHVSAFGVRSENQLAHDIKIGAAGELFIFEMLLRIGLPSFGRENWKSTIRKEVTVHPDYYDLTPWNGVETSDMVYNDSESALTRILIDNGYLPGNRWGGATPKYLIEVKSTTGACENAFFVRANIGGCNLTHSTRDSQNPKALSMLYFEFTTLEGMIWACAST